MDAGVPNNDVFTGRALTDRAGQNSIARQCFFNAARQHRFSVRVSDTFPPKPNHKPIPHSNPNTDPINPNSNPADPNLTLTPLNLPLTLTVTEQGRGMSNREIVPGGENCPFTDCQHSNDLLFRSAIRQPLSFSSLGAFTASEVTTLWRYRNVHIIIIIIIIILQSTQTSDHRES